MGFLAPKPPNIKPPVAPPSLASDSVQMAALRQKRAAASGGLLGGTRNVFGGAQMPSTSGDKTLLGA